jgi:hypothetical protein
LTTRAPHSGPWLIGGAGRSGKTTLTNILAANSRSVAGFPLEGVFHVYLQRHFPFFHHQRPRLLREYLTRPRYIDAGRTQVNYPLDYFDADAAKLAGDLPDTIDSPIALFGWLLDKFAVSQGKQSWAVFDLLPELRYATYRHLIPGVRLAVICRNPQEAIAEGLFWRTYPDPPADRERRFKSMLFQWCLSAMVTQSLSSRFGEDVKSFSFNRLLAADVSEQQRLAETFDMDSAAVKKAFAFESQFAYQPGRGFKGPDDIWRNLLTDREHEHIVAAVSGKVAYRDLRILLALAPRMPVQARSIADFTMYPGVNTKRRINALRQRARDTVAGVRAYRGDETYR